MKLYIPSAIDKRDLKGVSELFFLVPHMGITGYELLERNFGFWNSGYYSKLWMHPPVHERVQSMEECDVCVMPFKYDEKDDRLWAAQQEAEHYEKMVVAFYNDDNSAPVNPPGSNILVFKTSVDKSRMTVRERVMPVIIPDHFPCDIELGNTVRDGIITFCGHLEGVRKQIFDKMCTIWCSGRQFIERSGFWAAGMDKLVARREYYSNMLSGSYTLCMRGGGNFSYRFYEALSFGRVPVLIDTDNVLPFEDHIDWDKYIMRISFDDFMKSNISDFVTNRRANFSPIENRKLWEKWFSPEGYAKNWTLQI
jgi:hypothetical protein